MGDRANVVVRSAHGDVVLYTHWEGEALPKAVAAALLRGISRWRDAPYLARIIFSEMVIVDVYGTAGYGIFPSVLDGEDKVILVDCDNATVAVQDGPTMRFDEFITRPAWRLP